MTTIRPATIEDISARLGSLVGLCFTLAHAHDNGHDKQIVGAFFAIGNALEHEKEALDSAIVGNTEGGAS